MENKIRLMLVSSKSDSTILFKGMLENYKQYKIICEAQSGREAVEKAKEFYPDIIIMDVDMPEMDGFEAATQISQLMPYMGIILVGPAESLDVIRHAMQSGASYFLEFPFDFKRLHKVISEVNEIKESQKRCLIENPLIIPKREPKVISVFSSKGGVGKTVISANTTVALKELTHEDALVIDMDLQFGDVADLLNLNPKLSISDLITDIENVDINELGKYLTAHYSGIKVLAAPKQPEQADAVSRKDAKQIISLYSKKFDYIVVDLPPLFNEVVLECLEKTDNLILITTMEVPTIKNVKSSLEVLDKLGFQKEKITLAINRFNNNSEVGINDIRKFLGISKIFCIDDNSELVSNSINSGEPIVLKFKNTPIAKQLVELSKSLVEYRIVNKESSKVPFFKKIFGKGTEVNGK